MSTIQIERDIHTHKNTQTSTHKHSDMYAHTQTQRHTDKQTNTRSLLFHTLDIIPSVHWITHKYCCTLISRAHCWQTDWNIWKGRAQWEPGNRGTLQYKYKYKCSANTVWVKRPSQERWGEEGKRDNGTINHRRHIGAYLHQRPFLMGG